jgi:hypothetical protein
MARGRDFWLIPFLIFAWIAAGISQKPLSREHNMSSGRTNGYVQIHLSDFIIVPIVGAVAWYWGGKAVSPTLWMALIGYGGGRFAQWVRS